MKKSHCWPVYKIYKFNWIHILLKVWEWYWGNLKPSHPRSPPTHLTLRQMRLSGRNWRTFCQANGQPNSAAEDLVGSFLPDLHLLPKVGFAIFDVDIEIRMFFPRQRDETLLFVHNVPVEPLVKIAIQTFPYLKRCSIFKLVVLHIEAEVFIPRQQVHLGAGGRVCQLPVDVQALLRAGPKLHHTAILDVVGIHSHTLVPILKFCTSWPLWSHGLVLSHKILGVHDFNQGGTWGTTHPTIYPNVFSNDNLLLCILEAASRCRSGAMRKEAHGQEPNHTAQRCQKDAHTACFLWLLGLLCWLNIQEMNGGVACHGCTLFSGYENKPGALLSVGNGFLDCWDPRSMCKSWGLLGNSGMKMHNMYQLCCVRWVKTTENEDGSINMLLLCKCMK